MKISSILGLNARSQLYLSKNMKAGKKIADSKIATFRVMKASEVPTPQIYKKFRNPKDIFDFNWESLPNAFALKPRKIKNIFRISKFFINLRSGNFTCFHNPKCRNF